MAAGWEWGRFLLGSLEKLIFWENFHRSMAVSTGGVNYLRGKSEGINGGLRTGFLLIRAAGDFQNNLRFHRSAGPFPDLPHFVGDNMQGFLDGFRVPRAIEPQALGAVRPVVGQPKEEVLPGNHQHLAGFEALVEFPRGDRQAGEAEPTEEGEYDYNGRDYVAARLSARWTLSPTHIVYGSLGAQQSNYQGDQPVLGYEREELLLDAALGWQWRVSAAWMLNADLGYASNDSRRNTLYDYERTQAKLGATWRF